MADERGEKTEPPSARRLEEARERGQVARSPEAGVALSVLAAAAFFAWGGTGWLRSVTSLLPEALDEFTAGPWSLPEAEEFIAHMLSRFLALTVPLVLVVASAVVGANVLQVGFMYAPKRLEPSWERLNPLKGLRNLLGAAALGELAKTPVKLLVMGWVAYATIRPQLHELLRMVGRDPLAGMSTTGSLGLTLLWRLGAAHVVLAALDYLYQRWSVARALRMTRQEVRDEMKQAEGDPGIRARFRSQHRRYAMRRMMKDVATADVVVTNPTHLAVALRYDAGSMHAPRVVAKGARLVAQRIRELARAAGVPVLEHRPLAQALYKAVPVGGEIPAALYRAVAEVLAHVWALGRRRRS